MYVILYLSPLTLILRTGLKKKINLPQTFQAFISVFLPLVCS